MKRVKIDLTSPPDAATLARIDATSEADAERQATEDGALDLDAVVWRTVWPLRGADIKALRERLGLTQRDFADTYGLPLRALQNWEIDRREPDQTAKSYLTAISNDPIAVKRAYAGAAE